MIEPRIASKFSLKHDGSITIAVGRSRKETNWKKQRDVLVRISFKIK